MRHFDPLDLHLALMAVRDGTNALRSSNTTDYAMGPIGPVRIATPGRRPRTTACSDPTYVSGSSAARCTAPTNSQPMHQTLLTRLRQRFAGHAVAVAI